MNPKDRLRELLAIEEIAKAMAQEHRGHGNILEQLIRDHELETARHESAIAEIRARCEHSFEMGECFACGMKQVVTEMVEIDVSH